MAFKMTFHIRSRSLLGTGLALWLGLSGFVANTRPVAASPMQATLRSVVAHPVPADFRATVRLVTHTMPSIRGSETAATSLLLALSI